METSLLTKHPRLVEGPWRALSAAEQADFMLRLELHLLHAQGPLITRTHLFLETWAAPLPFYPGAMLVSSRLERSDGGIGVIDTVLAPGVIFCLTGSSGLIQAFNAGELQQLGSTSATVSRLLGQSHGSPLSGLGQPEAGMAYLRFFSAAVRGEEGGFHIVESPEQLARHGVVDKRGNIGALIEPMRWGGAVSQRAQDAPAWAIRANVLYAGHLFEAQFRLDSSGQVLMVDDTTLATSIGPSEVHSGLIRSILLPTEPKRPRKRGRNRSVPDAAVIQPHAAGAPRQVSVPAQWVLSARDPLLDRLRHGAAGQVNNAVPGQS